MPVASVVQAREGFIVGRTVSHYRVLELLGTRGMGTVYQADATRLRRRVALKFKGMPAKELGRAERPRNAAQCAPSPLPHVEYPRGPTGRRIPDLIIRHCSDGVNLVDFRHDAERARATINRWVEDNTRQKIRDLIPPDGLSDDTRLIVANAVDFKGTWVDQFDRTVTSGARENHRAAARAAGSLSC